MEGQNLGSGGHWVPVYWWEVVFSVKMSRVQLLDEDLEPGMSCRDSEWKGIGDEMLPKQRCERLSMKNRPWWHINQEFRESKKFGK